MPDYRTNDPRGWCGDPSRGAALGRPTIRGESANYAGKLALRRVRLDCQGYDPNGTYFGIGAPLYWCANDECTIDYVFRAADRAAARVRVLNDYPSARFYR